VLNIWIRYNKGSCL